LHRCREYTSNKYRLVPCRQVQTEAARGYHTVPSEVTLHGQMMPNHLAPWLHHEERRMGASSAAQMRAWLGLAVLYIMSTNALCGCVLINAEKAIVQRTSPSCTLDHTSLFLLVQIQDQTMLTLCMSPKTVNRHSGNERKSTSRALRTRSLT
jgi:hypothetical protein